MAQKYKNVYSTRTYSQTTPTQPVLPQAQSVTTFISCFSLFFPSGIAGPQNVQPPLSRLELLLVGSTHRWDTKANWWDVRGSLRGQDKHLVPVPVTPAGPLSKMLFPFLCLGNPAPFPTLAVSWCPNSEELWLLMLSWLWILLFLPPGSWVHRRHFTLAFWARILWVGFPTWSGKTTCSRLHSQNSEN